MPRKPPAPLPEGFIYRPEFISQSEEKELLENFSRLQFGEVRMHGVVARRRIIHYGWHYSFDTFRLTPGPPIPDFLLPLRETVAAVMELAPEDLAEALITEYQAGASIGWHRDAPPFGIVIAVSLAGSCRLRFRTGEGEERQTTELTVEPRSLYVISGEARTKWQHHIPATKELRYSITYRTLRRKA